METINIYEAKTKLSQLVDRASAGEPIIIARHGKPLAVLSAYHQESFNPPKRVGGQWKGQVQIPDDFNAADPELETLFYDNPLLPDGDK